MPKGLVGHFRREEMTNANKLVDDPVELSGDFALGWLGRGTEGATGLPVVTPFLMPALAFSPTSNTSLDMTVRSLRKDLSVLEERPATLERMQQPAETQVQPGIGRSNHGQKRQASALAR